MGDTCHTPHTVRSQGDFLCTNTHNTMSTFPPSLLPLQSDHIFFILSFVLFLLSFYYRFNCFDVFRCTQIHTEKENVYTIQNTFYRQVVQVHCRRISISNKSGRKFAHLKAKSMISSNWSMQNRNVENQIKSQHTLNIVMAFEKWRKDSSPTDFQNPFSSDKHFY